MAGEQIVEYAKALAGALGVSPAVLSGVVDKASASAAVLPPGVKAFVESGFDLRDAVVGQSQAAYTLALDQWRQTRDAIRKEILDALAAPIAAIPVLQELVKAVDLNAEEGLRFEQMIGPLTVHLDGGAIRAELGSGGQFSPDVLGPHLIDSLGGLLGAGPAAGGGTLKVDGDALAGVFALGLGAIDVSLVASLRRGAGDSPSFLGILGVAFTPGVQLGFGFSLDQIGGIVGVNRRADVDALAAGLRTGTVGDILFSTNPAKDASKILGAVDRYFPSSNGSHIFGPTLRLSWLSIHDAALFSWDVGMLLELPGPARVVIVGVGRAGIPPILRLRLDVLGDVDMERSLVAFNASLVDSGMLGVFTITGDAAFRQSLGSPPYTVLSIGGFYPGFDPSPAQLPPLTRAGLHLNVPVSGMTLRAQAYFAVTSNTLQFGGSLEVGFDAAGVSASGFLVVDALIQFSPFHFHAEVSAGFHVEAEGITLGSVRLDGTIDGPGPNVIRGRLTIEIFLHGISWDQTFTFGDPADTRTPQISLLDALAPELSNPANLKAGPGTDSLVVLAPLPSGRSLAAVPALSQVVWAQRRSPLQLPVDRLEGVPLGSTQTVSLTTKLTTNAPAAQTEKAPFSPGLFITLTNAEALNKPAFEELDAGIRLSWAAPEPSPDPQPKPKDHQVIRKVRDQPAQEINEPAPSSWRAAGPGIHTMIANRGRPATASARTPKVLVVSETWATDTGATHTSATAAHQQVREGTASLALPEVDMRRPIDLSGV